MATLRANGKTIISLKVSRANIEDDSGTQTTTETIYRAMSSGKVLTKTTWRGSIDGLPATSHSTGWKVKGKIKKSIAGDCAAIRRAMFNWQDDLISKGYDAEIM